MVLINNLNDLSFESLIISCYLIICRILSMYHIFEGSREFARLFFQKKKDYELFCNLHSKHSLSVAIIQKQ